MANRRLTDAYIQSLSSTGRRYEVQDAAAPGLRLRVSEAGKKTWCYVYRHAGRLRRMTLGHYPSMKLAKARVAAGAAWAARSEGVEPDPAAVKLARRQAAATDWTVEDLAREYVERHAKTRKKTWREDERMLQKDVVPSLGQLRAKDVKRGNVRDLLDTVAARGPVAANRTLEILRKAYNWAIEHELGGIEINPCWRLSRPAPERRRERVLTDAEIRWLWAALDRDRVTHQGRKASPADDLPVDWPSRPVRLALQLALVTAQRRGEIAEATQAEFDLRGGWWTIPGERTKNGLAHRVPLTPLAKRIVKELCELASDSAYLLPSPRGEDGPIGPGALSTAAARVRSKMGGERWTVHDLRRTAASRMASAGVSRIVIGKVLNHVEREITAVYDRHGYDKEKRDAMMMWHRILIHITKR